MRKAPVWSLGALAVLVVVVGLTSCSFTSTSSEGSISSPVDLSTVPASHIGGVDAASSYYVVTVVTGSSGHDVSVTGLSEDLDLYTYDDPSFDIVHLNGIGVGGSGISNNSGTASESVTGVSDSNHSWGHLYIEVRPHSGSEVSDFTLTVN
jgi:hypothetical protein